MLFMGKRYIPPGQPSQNPKSEEVGVLTDVRFIAWVKALRLAYYPTSLMALLVGLSVSFHIEIAHKAVLAWMVVGNFLLHCSCSLVNEYSDFITGADLVEYSKLSWKGATGGSKVLVHHLIKAKHVLYVSLFFFILSYGMWLFLAFETDVTLILLLSISLVVTFLYSAAYPRRGFSSIREVLLAFGAVPLFVLSVVKILSGVYVLSALAAGFIVGMQTLNYLLYHSILDLEADARSGKVRLARGLGLEGALVLSEMLMAGTFVGLAGAVYGGLFPKGCALPFVLVPFSAKVIYAEMRKVNIVENYVEIVLLFVGFNGLLSLGFFL